MLAVLRLRSALVQLVGLSFALVLQAGSAAAQDAAPGPEEIGLEEAAISAPLSAPVLPREALEAAGAYRLYMHRAAQLSADFTDGEAVARSLRTGAAYEPGQLARGAVAFAAVAALQEPEFTAAVRAAGADPVRRKALASTLLSDPRAAADLGGAPEAAARITAALAGEGGAVRDVGRRVKQSAYDVQRLAWSRLEVTGRVDRLAEAKSLSATRLAPTEEEIARATRLSSTEGGLWTVSSLAGLDRPVVLRGLALAALAVLGEADPRSTEPLLQDPACASCLRMAKLNLFQCLAVAKPWYEDVFCLGQHILIDTGECIRAAALPRSPNAMTIARREDD